MSDQEMAPRLLLLKQTQVKLKLSKVFVSLLVPFLKRISRAVFPNQGYEDLWGYAVTLQGVLGIH